MAFVVTETCIKCKYMDCVEVCPVDCFHEGPNFLVIDPDECIDCTLCEPECPVEAIFSEEEIPDGQESFLKLNAELTIGGLSVREVNGQPMFVMTRTYSRGHVTTADIRAAVMEIARKGDWVEQQLTSTDVF